jgi:hypothetical protein
MKHLPFCLVMICSLLLANCNNSDDAGYQDDTGYENQVDDDGLPETEPPEIEPPETEPLETEPPEAEPPEAEPPETEPPETEPPETEPPATDPPGTGQSGTGQSGTGQSGTGQSGTGQSGTGQSGTGQSGTGQSGTGQSGTGQSGTGQSGTGQSGTGQSGTGQSGTGQSGTGQSGTGQSGTGQSGTGQSGTGQSGTDQSGTGQSGTGQSGTGQSGTGQSETEQSGTDQSGTGSQDGDPGDDGEGDINLQGTNPEDLPRITLNEIMDIISDTSEPIDIKQHVEFINNLNINHGNVLELVIYRKNRDIQAINLPGFFNSQIPHRPYYTLYTNGNEKKPCYTKTCIITLMEDSNYIDAVCLIENESSDWPAGYEYFQEVMQKLYDAKLWQSNKGELPGPQDCVVTSSITSSAMSVNRREGTTIYHTADDWYIAESTFKAANNNPPPTN